MIDTTNAASPTVGDADMINELSELRKDVYSLVERMDAILAVKPKCIAELTLSKRELQSARHWMGECLKFYPTGYRVTDNPKDPGSESRVAEPGSALPSDGAQAA